MGNRGPGQYAPSMSKAFAAARELDDVRWDLRHARTPDLTRRRKILALSLLGMASMAPVVLYQTGLLRRLPDPPLRRFDSAAANSSDEAYKYGVPDGVVLTALFGLSAVLAAFGTADRSRKAPAIPLAASAKAGVESAFAAKYFSLMATGREPWCLFCIAAAFIQFAIFGLTLPEARESARISGRRPPV